MIANFHTHTVFCDGKNTPEQIVLSAIERGFCTIGFSGHGYTDFDIRYCIKDVEGYQAEIRRHKEKHKGEIEVYLGVEEDAFCYVNRGDYDYIIGSSHYFCLDGKYLPIDSSHEYFKKCLEAFSYDTHRLAETYYGAFCAYINQRKPDIIGHFDLITKFDELGKSLFLKDGEYQAVARGAAIEAAKSCSLFEVNTGAITRGMRTSVYPSEDILFALRNEGARLILSSDSHEVATLDGCFAEVRAYLYDIGFRHLYTLFNGEFIKYDIK